MTKTISVDIPMSIDDYNEFANRPSFKILADVIYEFPVLEGQEKKLKVKAIKFHSATGITSVELERLEQIENE